MSQELLYTSAPSGLNPTDQGFCTVVCTQGMPRNLKEFLESLSGYRQADKPPHPVNYSHVVHSMAGKKYSVLSRVSDYEKDYSGRTNKLAHHVAFAMDELPPSGPAALLGTSLFKTTWDKQTRWEPSGPVAPAPPPTHGPCRTWEAITGDAGWAGVLAESAADGSNRPIYVIFPPGQNVLPLVQEALGVLPREHAWTTSFSTYFTKLPAGVDCLWRFVLDGSPEAQQARAASHSRAIDLTELQRSRRRAPEGNPYVAAARSGRVMDAPSAAMGRGTFSPSAPSPVATASGAASATILQEASAPPSPFATGTSAPASPFAKPFREEKGPSKLPYILGGAALVLLIGVGALVYSMMTKGLPDSVTTSDSSASRNRKTQTAPQLNKDAFLSEADKARQEEEAKKAAQKTIVQPVQEQPKQETAKITQTPMDTKIEQKGPWDETLKTLGGYLILPPRNQTLGVVSNPEPFLLSKIHVEDPKTIDLAISSSKGSSKAIGRDDPDTEGLILTAENEETDDGKESRKWVVQRKVIDQFTKLPKVTQIASFALSEENLTFLWNMEAPDWAKANSLQYCVLEISNGKNQQRFRLSKPKSIDNEKYELASRNQKFDLAVNPNAVDEPKDLFLDVQLLGVGPEAFSKTGLKVGETATFGIKREVKSGNGRVEFDISFRYDGARPFIEVDAKTFRKVLVTMDARQNKEELRTLGGPARNKAHQIPLEELRFSTVVSDFERIAEFADKIARSLNTSQTLRGLEDAEIPGIDRSIRSLRDDLKDADAQEAAEIEGKINDLEKKKAGFVDIVNKYKDRIKQITSQIPWSKEMQPHFEELGKSARLGYSLYIVVDGEKVFLAQTKGEVPAPKKPGNENTKP